MAIPYPASYQQGSYAVLVHQGLFGFAANSEASLLTAMNTLKLKNGIIKENTKTKLIQNELKAAFNVDNPKKIDKQALINLMETKLGITLSAADEAALLSQKQVTIVSQILARADVVNKFLGPIDSFLQDAAVDPTNFQTNLNNVAPTDILPNDASVAEDAAGGSLITTLTAVDPDAGDTFTFSLVNDPSGKFDVLGNGQVRLKAGATLDFETVPSYQVTVKVVDQFGNAYQETVTINVTDVEPEPGNVVALEPGLDLIDGTNDATVNDDLFTGSTIFSQFVANGPVSISGTATAGDFIDGDDGDDTFALTIGGSGINVPGGEVVSSGIITENVENLVVINAFNGNADVIVDMTTHQDVENVSLLFSNTDIMLRDMQAPMVGGTVLIQDPTAGTDVQLDFDIQALNGPADQFNVIVDEMIGGGIEITQDAEGNGGGIGDGDPADLEQLNVAFEGNPSQLDYLTSAGTSTFIFTGAANTVIGAGPGEIDQFGLNGNSFFDDMGNESAVLIDASAMTGSLYINLAGADTAPGFTTFRGSAGDDLTVIGSSQSFGTEQVNFDGRGGTNTAVLFNSASVSADDNGNGAANNPLVNYQNVLFTEPMGLNSSIDARFFGQQVQNIVFMDGLFGVGTLTVNRVESLPAGTVFSFEGEEEVNPDFFGDNNGIDGTTFGQTMAFNTALNVPAVEVTVHFDDADPVTDSVTFQGSNVGVMNLGGDGSDAKENPVLPATLLTQTVTFEGTVVGAAMDNLTKITADGGNKFVLASNGSLGLLNTIDGSANSGGIIMQDGVLPPVTTVLGHQVASDITSDVLGLTLKGSSAADVLIGGEGGDNIAGNNGADYLSGNGGSDTMNGGAGDDQMQGGDGSDIMFGGANNDLMVGGDGDDSVNGEAGVDTIYGWAGNDKLDGGADSRDVVKGGAGDDQVAGGAGVDSHWGDRDAADANDPANGLGTPQSTTIDINSADVGDVFTVSVTGHGGVDYLVSVASAGSEAGVAAAIVTALEAAGMDPALVSSSGDVITILGTDNDDAFTVNTSVTNLPGISTITYAAGADIGDQIVLDVNGVLPTVLATETLTNVQVASLVAATINAAGISGVSATVSAGVVTVTNLNGPFSSLSSNVGNDGTSAYLDINVTDFDDGEQVSVIVDGITYTTGGVGLTAEQALNALATAIINGEGAAGTSTAVVTEGAPGSFTLRIIDTDAADANGWGDATADVISNVQILGGDGGTGNTPTVTYVAGAATPAGVVAVVQAGTAAGNTNAVNTVANVPDAIDDNSTFGSDTFVIETNAAGTNIVVLATASDDGGATIAVGDAIPTDADALASMDIIWDWNAGGTPDKLNFALLNQAGDISNYNETTGATSLLDAVAAINGLLDGTVRFAAAEVFLAGPITADLDPGAGVTPLTIGGGYHTLVGADANGDGSVDQLTILVGVGSGAAGADGFTQTDIVTIPV